MKTANLSKPGKGTEVERKHLRILLVEDSEHDAELLIRYLKNTFDLHYRRVQDAFEMEDALKNEDWDVVLCDYWLPGFGVVPAMELLHGRGLDLPFIVVSGTIGEELAVQTMKAGAHDYIMKDNLTRLAPAIEREIRQALSRRERKRTLTKAAWLAAIVDSMGEAVIGLDLTGRIASWNAGAELLYGFTAQEALGNSLHLVLPPELHPDAETMLETMRQGGPWMESETVRLRKNGTRVDVFSVMSSVKDETGRVIGAAILARDITERKQAEEERKKMITELNETLAQVRQLHGLLPICASCKKIRDEKGSWQPLEKYISGHSEAEFSHSICPSCAQTLYPDYVGKK